MNKGSEIRCTGHFLIRDGIIRELDAKEKSQLADRCKLVLTEIITGERCEFQKIS